MDLRGAVVLDVDVPTVIVGRCTVPGCGEEFHEGQEQAWQEHVGPCARRHMDRIHESIERNRLPIFEDYDPEVSAYLQGTVRPRMEREGRWEIRPNEATGTTN